jgi:two-component system, chemotaxis family, sensor kinase CheA
LGQEAAEGKTPGAPVMGNDMDDLLREFLTETNENLAMLDNELIKLEQNPNDPALLNTIFRAVHTIKGTCGFLGLPRLEQVAHAGENILGKFRDGKLPVTPYSVTLILAALDRIKTLLAALEATGAEPEGGDAELILQLNNHADGKDGGGASAPVPVATPVAPVAAAGPVPDEHGFVPVPAHLTGAAPASVAEPVPDEHGFVPVTAAELAAQAAPAAPAAAASAPAKEAAPAGESALAGQSLRVNVDVLEGLMTMVSELVLIRNQMLQILRTQKDTDFAPPLQRLNHVTSDLQEQVMKTRMQPIGNAWSKLPRIIRDLSSELGKKIDLQMLGADTELDRQVLEMIKDPLTHMVRNSADHGLETPAERLKAGKKEVGHVTLNAYHEGGHIIIQIADDGRGLPTQKIRDKIVKQGMATEAEVKAMTDAQVHMYIFKAGFSTAAAVTAVSGRGVGMDVVRTNIEKIGGTIDMKSVEGKGSTFTIKIPLTLAIVSALIVESANERFAIPQINVLELVRAGGKNSGNTIERISNAPVLRLRNRLLPLVTLHELLHLPAPAQAAQTTEATIAVLQVGKQTVGVIVDRVFDTEEIVVKPVAPILRHIEMFSGNTILGDGSVIMILDPNGIANAAGSLGTEQEQEVMQDTRARAAQSGDKLAMLLFRAGDAAPKAVPLSLVARLEDIDVSTIERTGGQAVVQYRGSLMPLIPLNERVKILTEGNQPVLVFADRERSVGLVVDEIVDIVEEQLAVQLSGDQPGLMGSAIISGRSTEVIDAGFYLTRTFKDFFGATTSYQGGGDASRPQRVLLVDDSSFFRNMLTPLLNVSGYQVTTVESAIDALQLCESEVEFDIIVSDIEMPGMSGFEFVEALKKNARWAKTPVIALSSHATNIDQDRGRKAGFANHVAKFDREALLSTLSQTLNSLRGAA